MVILNKLICWDVVGMWSVKVVGIWLVNQINLFTITNDYNCYWYCFHISLQLYESSSEDSVGEDQEALTVKGASQVKGKARKVKTKDVEGMVDVEDLGKVMSKIKKTQVSLDFIPWWEFARGVQPTQWNPKLRAVFEWLCMGPKGWLCIMVLLMFQEGETDGDGNMPGEPKEMLTPLVRQSLTKQGEVLMQCNVVWFSVGLRAFWLAWLSFQLTCASLPWLLFSPVNYFI